MSFKNIGNVEITDHSFSLIFHVLFLFIALSLLLVFIISKIETQVFQDQIDQRLTSIIPTTLSNNDKNGILKQLFKDKQSTLNDLKNFYSSNTNNTDTNNSYLKIIMIIIAVTLLLLILIPYLYLKFVGNYDVSLGKILTENLILFIFVGAFEAFFFFKFAKNYIPVLPSVFVNSVYQDIQN